MPFGQGDLWETVTKALLVLSNRLGVIRAQSRLYQTPAFPPGSGPDFVNAAVSIDTSLAPEKIIQSLHTIEAEFGRRRDKRWGPRTLDLDLIAVGSNVSPDQQTYQHWADLPLDAQMTTAPDILILPHPRMHERAFVLVPLADVAPDWTHPVIGLTVLRMLERLPEAARKEVRPL